MSRAVAGTVVLVLFVVSVATAPALASSPQNGLQTPDGFDESTVRIAVYENGSATWTLEHRTPLNDSERERFESYADRFESEETALYADFVGDAGLLTRYGTNETGREMDARNFQRSAFVDPAQSRGTVRMSFLWTNFAAVDGHRVVVSDVFEGGFYVGEGQSLVVERGPSLGFASARPTPDTRSQPDSLADSESVTWVGEQSFNDRRPYVELAPRSAVGETTSTPAAGGNGDGLWRFVALLLVLALGAVAVAAWRSGAAAAVLDSGDGDGDDGAAAATPTSDPEPTVSETELLSDSDRVVKLLEENGGRMKQVDIVETTDWSKSKVSMLLSDMEEDGQISKLRVGRENIVSIAGEEPDAAGSPFDEE